MKVKRKMIKYMLTVFLHFGTVEDKQGLTRLNEILFCYSVPNVLSSFAIILTRKRELDAFTIVVFLLCCALWLSLSCRGLVCSV